MDDIRKAKQISDSRPEGVRPRSVWWESVRTDIKKGKIRKWREISRKGTEWKKNTENAKVHLGLQGQPKRK
jgi:hypothetical protein